MDTNDLTEKAYEILNLSEDINHLITVHIGAMCSRFKQEDDFLNAVVKFIQSIMDEPEDFIGDWGIENEIDVAPLILSLSNLKTYVEETIKIPLKKRGLTIEEIDFK